MLMDRDKWCVRLTIINDIIMSGILIISRHFYPLNRILFPIVSNKYTPYFVAWIRSKMIHRAISHPQYHIFFSPANREKVNKKPEYLIYSYWFFLCFTKSIEVHHDPGVVYLLYIINIILLGQI